MGYHYIPQFYLKGFANENVIWVHDRKDRRSFASQPKSVANETDMYPDGTAKGVGFALFAATKSVSLFELG
jgi:hypothetical protein